MIFSDLVKGKGSLWQGCYTTEVAFSGRCTCSFVHFSSKTIIFPINTKRQKLCTFAKQYFLFNKISSLSCSFPPKWTHSKKHKHYLFDVFSLNIVRKLLKSTNYYMLYMFILEEYHSFSAVVMCWTRLARLHTFYLWNYCSAQVFLSLTFCFINLRHRKFDFLWLNFRLTDSFSWQEAMENLIEKDI